MTSTTEADIPHDAVNEKLPAGKLATLGLQHVLVMYAGAIAVPLIVGRVLKLTPEQVAFLISADLFVCGVVTIIQSLGASKWFGIRLPVMMGVTFASGLGRRPNDLWRHYRRRDYRDADCAVNQPNASLLPASGYWHDHSGHRGNADAGWY